MLEKTGCVSVVFCFQGGAGSLLASPHMLTGRHPDIYSRVDAGNRGCNISMRAPVAWKMHCLTLHGVNWPHRALCSGRVWDQTGEGGEGMREQRGQLTSFMPQKTNLKVISGL